MVSWVSGEGGAVAMRTKVRDPILLARELLVRRDGDGGASGRQGHKFLSGAEAEGLDVGWGCEVVERRGDGRALTWVEGGERVFH